MLAVAIAGAALAAGALLRYKVIAPFSRVLRLSEELDPLHSAPDRAETAEPGRSPAYSQLEWPNGKPGLRRI
ncbi:MAG: hypothetical protein JWO80_6321 [Bryobacterales bacterium]|nr:hypothetical protein [Bryobacterales bacterium]